MTVSAIQLSMFAGVDPNWPEIGEFIDRNLWPSVSVVVVVVATP